MNRLLEKNKIKLGLKKYLCQLSNLVTFGKKVVVMMIMEMKCFVLKTAKVEKCFMDQLMKNSLQIYLDQVLNLKNHFLNYYIIYNGNLEMKLDQDLE